MPHQLALGFDHTCVVVHQQVLCFGYNLTGALDRPESGMDAAVVPGLADVVEVVAGSYLVSAKLPFRF